MALFELFQFFDNIFFKFYKSRLFTINIFQCATYTHMIITFYTLISFLIISIWHPQQMSKFGRPPTEKPPPPVMFSEQSLSAIVDLVRYCVC